MLGRLLSARWETAAARCPNAALRNALLAVGLARQRIPGGDTVFEGEAGFYFSYAGVCASPGCP